jgi:hypothetical protein
MPVGKQTLGRPSRKWENNMKKYIKDFDYEMDSNGSGLCPMAGLV